MGFHVFDKYYKSDSVIGSHRNPHPWQINYRIGFSTRRTESDVEKLGDNFSYHWVNSVRRFKNFLRDPIRPRRPPIGASSSCGGVELLNLASNCRVFLRRFCWADGRLDHLQGFVFPYGSLDFDCFFIFPHYLSLGLSALNYSRKKLGRRQEQKTVFSFVIISCRNTWFIGFLLLLCCNGVDERLFCDDKSRFCCNVLFLGIGKVFLCGCAGNQWRTLA